MSNEDNVDLNETAEIPKEKVGIPSENKKPAIAEISKVDDLVGKKLGRYRIESCLGKGSMGTVYLARESFLKRYVALKVLSPKLTNSPEALEKFKKEARLLAMLNHPNITSIFLFEEQDDVYYFVFEFVRGDTLEKVLVKKEKFSLRESAKIIYEVLKALAHAHKLGIVHRDIKPSNIMMDSVNRVKVTDFGLAAQTKLFLEGTNIISGTPHYISPEQIKGLSISPATDIYSTGILFYQLLTGEIPFKADSVEKIFKLHLETDLPKFSQSVRTIPTAIEQIIRKMTHKNPDSRYQSAKEVMKDLEEFKSTKPANKAQSIGKEIEIKFDVLYEEFVSEYDDKEVVMLKVAGSLEATTMEKLNNYIKQALSKNLNRIIVDFEKLTYINSSGMSMFIPYIDQLHVNSGEMIFIKTSDKIFKVFELLGLQNIYIFHATLNNALKELAKTSSSNSEANEVVVFPFSYQCNSCSRFFKIPSQGKYTCPYCEASFVVNSQGQVKSEKVEVEHPYHIRVPSITPSLSLIRGALRGLFATLEFSDENEYQVIQAVDEACANVIAYAGKGDTSFEIVLQIYALNKKIKIHIMDKGELFNPLAQKPVDVNKRFQMKKVGGIGLELIKKCMTSVEYKELKSGGNELILIKEQI
jgi:anti-anti-sigma factor